MASVRSASSRSCRPSRRPALERDERVARLGAGRARRRPARVVATNRGSGCPAATGRLGWHEIHKAVWSGRELAVTAAPSRSRSADGLHW